MPIRAFTFLAFLSLVAAQSFALPPSYEREVSLPIQTLEGTGGALLGLVIATGVLITTESDSTPSGSTIAGVYGFSYLLGMGVGLSTTFIEGKDPVSFAGMFSGIALGIGLDALAYNVSERIVSKPYALPFVIMAFVGPAFCGALGSRLPWWQVSSRHFGLAPYMPEPDAPGIQINAHW